MVGIMLKTDKILKQTIFITILIILWIGASMFFLITDLRSQKRINDYQTNLSRITVEVNEYYQSIFEITEMNPSSARYEINPSQSTILSKGILSNDLSSLLHLTENMGLTYETHRSSLRASILRAHDAVMQLESIEGTIYLESFMLIQGSELKAIMSEVDLITQTILQEQDLRRGMIRQKLIISAVSLIVIIAAAFIWLMVVRTLKPLKKIERAFSKENSSFKGHLIEFESDDEIGNLIKSYNQLQGRTATIESLIKKLGEQDHFEAILDFIFESFKPFIPYNRIGIAVLSSDHSQIRALSARSDRAVKLGKNYTLDLKQTSLTSIIESGEPRILNDLESYYNLRRNSESTGLMLEEGMYSSVTLPLIVRQECVGVVFFSSEEKNTYNESHITFLRTIAGSLASAFDHSFLNDQLLVSTIQGFAQLVESKDSETGNHIDRMQRYSIMIAEMLYMKKAFPNELNEQLIKEIRDFSPLHDIGKVAVPDHILLKPGKLTQEEFSVMKEHAVIGSDILQNMNKQITGQNRDFYKTGIDIVRHHHEKYDGSGYPDRLSGTRIPLPARIVALADVLDALTSKRPYKEAFSMERAKAIVMDGRGSHFDPIIVDIVLEYWDKFVNQADAFIEMESETTLSMIS